MERQVGLVRGTRWPWDQVRAAWWQEEQDEVKNGSLVEPQSQDQAGTTVTDWHGGHT
jgi:hypothetical protein